MTPDLRRLRAFLAVAEHLSFTRAARELEVGQPALSQTIRSLERELGQPLFRRTTRSVALTEAGVALAADLAPAVSALDTAVDRARAPLANALRVAFNAGGVGLMLTEVLHASNAAHPHVEIRLERLEWGDELRSLRSGRTDVAMVRPPVDARGLRTVLLLTDRRVVALAATHRLARLPRIHIDQLADEPIVHGGPEAPVAAQDYWTVNPRPDGRPPVWGPTARSTDELLEHVALGTAVAIIAATVPGHYARTDITFRTLDGVPPTPLLLATPLQQQNHLVRSFQGLALAVAAEASHGVATA